MATDPTNGPEDLSTLPERMRSLEARIARIEERLGFAIQPEPSAQTQGTLSVPTGDGLAAATLLTRVAMLSFVLMGALILRALTEQKILGPWLGTLLGFAYAGHLIFLSFLPGHLGRLARTTSLFQCCGVLLGYSIALESALQAHTFGRLTAMAFMAGFAVLAGGVAVAHRKLSLAWFALAGSALAVVALGFEAQGLSMQLAWLTVLGAATAGLSWRREWSLLRPLVFPLLLGLLAAGFLLAHRESLDRGPLLASAIAFWAIIALQHLLALERLDWHAALWLPAVSAWLAGLAWHEECAWLAQAASGASGAAILALAWASRWRTAAVAGAAGLAVTGAVVGAFGWPMLDASGILCALAGLGLWLAAGKGLPAWAAGCAALLLAAAAVRGVLQVLDPSAPVLSLVAGAFLAALLLFHYLRTAGPAGEAPAPSEQVPGYLAPGVLVAALLVFLGVLRACGQRLLPDPAYFQLSQTGVLTLTATGLTIWGQLGRRRAVKYIGLTCIFLSLVKVGLGDLMHLSGIPLIASVVLLGLSSVAISVVLHRRGGA